MTTTTQTLRVRRLRTDDTQVIDTVFAGLSDRSRYLRFHSPVPRLNGSLRRMLLNVDDRDRLALVAEARTSDGWEPIGVARLIRTTPAQAEVAGAVIDAWHRRGVGRTLLTAVRVAATDHGLDRLTALVLAENRAAQGLIRSVFPLCTSRPDGPAVHMTCHLRREPGHECPPAHDGSGRGGEAVAGAANRVQVAGPRRRLTVALSGVGRSDEAADEGERGDGDSADTSHEVVVFDREPLAIAAVSAPAVMRQLSAATLAGLDHIPKRQRALLLETFERCGGRNGSPMTVGRWWCG